MRAMLLGATILGLLALPATAEPLAPPARSGATTMLPIDFDLLKQAEKQSQQEQDEAARKAAEDAAQKAQADKAAADRVAADKSAADKAAADKAASSLSPPAPASAPPSASTTPAASAPVAQTAHVSVKLATGSTAGSAELTETPGGLHVLLSFANIPAGRYRLAVLPLPECGKPFAAPPGPAQAIPIVTAGPNGTIAAAFTIRRHLIAAAGGGPHWPVLALYPADAKPGTGWTACGGIL